MSRPVSVAGEVRSVSVRSVLPCCMWQISTRLSVADHLTLAEVLSRP